MSTEHTTESQQPHPCALESQNAERVCYALKVYNYDDYEREKVMAVSFDADKLREHYKTVDHLYHDAPLVESSQHEEFYDLDEPHWVVEEVLFLRDDIYHPKDGCAPHPRKAPLRIGGVMRCCMETLDTTPVMETEGEVLKCKHCRQSLVFTDGCWGWREKEKGKP